MNTLLALALVAGLQTSGQERVKPVPGSELELSVSAPAKAVPVKKSPKHDWTFDTVTDVLVNDRGETKLRFRVWSNAGTKGALQPGPVAHYLARLYDYNMTKLRLDHSYQYGDQNVDVYLCQEGNAGGEQAFGEDDVWKDETGRRRKVNSIFVYDVDTLEDPLEACRELAHEYGHATLPPVSIPQGREEWANGHLGERLYLTWLARDVKAGKLEPSDLFGATLADLVVYSNAKILPLIQNADKKFPQLLELDKKDDTGFSAYLAFSLYCERTLPVQVFRRALVLNDKQTAVGFFQAVMEALDEREDPVPISPPIPGQRVFFAPNGHAKLSNCKLISTTGFWRKVEANGTVLRKSLARH